MDILNKIDGMLEEEMKPIMTRQHFIVIADILVHLIKENICLVPKMFKIIDSVSNEMLVNTSPRFDKAKFRNYVLQKVREKKIEVPEEESNG